MRCFIFIINVPVHYVHYYVKCPRSLSMKLFCWLHVGLHFSSILAPFWLLFRAFWCPEGGPEANVHFQHGLRPVLTPFRALRELSGSSPGTILGAVLCFSRHLFEGLVRACFWTRFEADLSLVFERFGAYFCNPF